MIRIVLYSQSCLGQETAKESLILWVKLPLAHLCATHSGGCTLSIFYCWTSCRKTMNAIFMFLLWRKFNGQPANSVDKNLIKFTRTLEHWKSRWGFLQLRSSHCYEKSADRPLFSVLRYPVTAGYLCAATTRREIKLESIVLVARQQLEFGRFPIFAEFYRLTSLFSFFKWFH